MALMKKETINVLGLVVSGDLADMTIYTMKNGTKVFFEKAPPKEPPSPDQLTIRNRWRQAATGWKQLGEEGQRLWRLATTRAHARFTAYNIWVSLFVRPDPSAFQTLQNISGITLPT